MAVSTDVLTNPLDRLEAALPTVPSRAVALGRATVRRGNDVSCSVVRRVAGSVASVADVTSSAARTVTGQARSAAGRTVSTATIGARTVAGQADAASERVAAAASGAAKEVTGQGRAQAGRVAAAASGAAKEVTGQGRAQAGRVAAAAEDQAETLLDDAIEATDPATALEDLTKDELYERAQERDIDGRSTMSKGQLVAALRDGRA